MDDIAFRQQQAAERWAARQQEPKAGQSTDRSKSHDSAYDSRRRKE
jgi:hypothetical protein